jgi:hypothetical protein
MVQMEVALFAQFVILDFTQKELAVPNVLLIIAQIVKLKIIV